MDVFAAAKRQYRLQLRPDEVLAEANWAGDPPRLNERRSGRSDRSADFRLLASWFAGCASDAEAHRLARAAFALNPARHWEKRLPSL